MEVLKLQALEAPPGHLYKQKQPRVFHYERLESIKWYLHQF